MELGEGVDPVELEEGGDCVEPGEGVDPVELQEGSH